MTDSPTKVIVPISVENGEGAVDVGMVAPDTAGGGANEVKGVDPKPWYQQPFGSLASEKAPGRQITWGSVLAATGFLIAGVAVMTILLLTMTKDLPFKVDSAWQAYAGLFVLAFAIERMIQPFSDVLGDTAAPQDDKETKKKAATNTAVVTWGLATGLGLIACAALKVGLLTTIRAANVSAPNRWLDVIVSGLIVGAGTKPLHDLIGQVQASKDNKQAAAED